MRGIPKSYAETIAAMAENPDYLQGFCYHIHTYQQGVSYITEALLNVMCGDFNALQFTRELAMTFHHWKDSLESDGFEKDDVQGFLRQLRLEVINRIKRLTVN